VLRPLAELAPDEVHPGSGERYRVLWETYDRASQPVRRVAFLWRGRSISLGE